MSSRVQRPKADEHDMADWWQQCAYPMDDPEAAGTPVTEVRQSWLLWLTDRGFDHGQGQRGRWSAYAREAGIRRTKDDTGAMCLRGWEVYPPLVGDDEDAHRPETDEAPVTPVVGAGDRGTVLGVIQMFERARLIAPSVARDARREVLTDGDQA